MPDVGILLLAAGGSMRMGRPKQLLRIAGQSMLRRAACAAVESGCTPAVVVLGAQAEEVRGELTGLPVTIAVNSSWQRGLGSSIRCGMQALLRNRTELSSRAVVLLLGDQPLVTADVIRRLTAAYVNCGKPICVSAFRGTFGPPVVVDSRYFDLLLALPDDQGAKAVWAGRPDEVHLEPCPEAAIDIDTPADYQRLFEIDH
jgi:molybdenum cofactor cytidylyltransferase